MRVLITTDAVGGVWTYTSTLVRALVERGDSCMVAIVGEPTAGQLASLPAGVDREAAPHPLEWLPGVGEEDIRRATGWLEGLARRWGAELVHLNQFAYAAGDFGAPTVVVAHSDVLSWFGEVQDRAAGPEWERYRGWVRAGLTSAGAVVAPTCYQSGLLARHYGRAADRVIYNGAPAPPPAERTPASARPFVLAAGRAWDEAKGVAVLDEALDLMGEAAPSAHLAGPLEGPAGESYRPRRLSAHGRVDRAAMDRLYDNTALYVAPSLYEPFGLSPLEAALHGCGLVLSDIGSFRELWQDAAVFVPPGSPGPLASALADLLDDRPRLDALAAVARARARDRYTVARMAEGYRALYAGLTGQALEVAL